MPHVTATIQVEFEEQEETFVFDVDVTGNFYNGYMEDLFVEQIAFSDTGECVDTKGFNLTDKQWERAEQALYKLYREAA